MVDYLVGSTYGETNLDEDPCLIPDCGHLITMSSMDGNFSLGNFYEIDNDTGEVLALKGSAPPFSVEDIKNCPVCRGPLRNINRYSRIIRRSAIDEATKKFVSWSNAEIIKHADSLHRIQQQLRESEVTTEDYQSGNSFRPSVPNPEELRDKMTLRGDRNEVIANISMVRSLQKRYDWPFLQRQRLEKFLNQVREEEQPFRRLWDLSRARQRRNPFSCSEGDLDFTPDTFQSRAFLMSLSLSIQFDITILADALTVRKKMTGLTARYDWAAVDLEVDFSEMRAECSTLANLCLVQNQPRLEIEAKLAFAHLAALERSAIVTSRQIERSNRLQQLGLDQVSEARRIHEQFPGQTTGVMTELEAVERMLNDGTFYNVVTSEEKQAVYEAMRQQFSGTGHWYTCANGHAFTVGECGMPMEETRCPQCGSPIGGRHHEPAQGVRRIDDLQAAMGNLELNDGV